MLHDQRHRRCNGIVSVAANNELDFLHIEKTLVEARDKIRVGLIVETDEFHRPAEEFAVLIDGLLPNLVCELCCFTVRREAARKRQAISDFEGRCIHTNLSPLVSIQRQAGKCSRAALKLYPSIAMLAKCCATAYQSSV